MAGGIYIIVNVLDAKAYVGQAKSFTKRDHISNLIEGTDNKQLQEDYEDMQKDREFVYFMIGDAGEDPNKKMLDPYEKLFMTLTEDEGFCLYNCNIQREDREYNKLGLSEDEITKAKQELDNEFYTRFKMTPTQIVESETRQDALENYAKQRLNGVKFKWDRFIFNRKRISGILGEQTKSISVLDISEVHLSKAGGYIGEGIDQILFKKINNIKNNNYCLWAFANNAISEEQVRICCKKRALEGKDTYVIFSYTPSSLYADDVPYEYQMIKKGTVKGISKKELSLQDLGCEKNIKGRYILPQDVVCTGASSTSVNAFVIETLSMLEENIEVSFWENNYKAINADGNCYDVKDGGFSRSTWLLRKGTHSDAVMITNDNKSNRRICIAAKLKEPYIIKLERLDE